MRNAFFVVLMIGLLVMQAAASYADWHGHDSGYVHGGGHGYGGWHGHSYVGIGLSLWPDGYYYDAPYYPDGVLVSPPVTVAQQPVEVIQPPAVIDNQAQTVAAPEVTTPGTTSDIPDSITINIPNSKGGYTAVTFKKSGNGFIGPQGEFYPEFPKVSQLKVIYGK